MVIADPTIRKIKSRKEGVILRVNHHKPMIGFIKAFHTAKATIDGIEAAHMIGKGQLSKIDMPTYKQFMALAG